MISLLGGPRNEWRHDIRHSNKAIVRGTLKGNPCLFGSESPRFEQLGHQISTFSGRCRVTCARRRQSRPARVRMVEKILIEKADKGQGELDVCRVAFRADSRASACISCNKPRSRSSSLRLYDLVFNSFFIPPLFR